MRIAVPKETAPLERRVGLVPDGVTRLVKAGQAGGVEQGAGVAAGIPDAAFTQAGAGGRRWSRSRRAQKRA